MIFSASTSQFCKLGKVSTFEITRCSQEAPFSHHVGCQVLTCKHFVRIHLLMSQKFPRNIFVARSQHSWQSFLYAYTVPEFVFTEFLLNVELMVLCMTAMELTQMLQRTQTSHWNHALNQRKNLRKRYRFYTFTFMLKFRLFFYFVIKGKPCCFLTKGRPNYSLSFLFLNK